MNRIQYLVMLGTVALAVCSNASEQVEISIKNNSSVQHSPQNRMVDKNYRDRLKSIKQEIETLQASLMLYEPAIHAERLTHIEGKFKLLGKEIAAQHLEGMVSRVFWQYHADVEREIERTKELLGIKKPEEAVE